MRHSRGLEESNGSTFTDLEPSFVEDVEIPQNEYGMQLKANQKLLKDNTAMAESLEEALAIINEYEVKMASLEHHLAEQREINEIIRDCIIKFANETSLSSLIRIFSDYIKFYYKPDSLVLYLSDDSITSETGKFQHMYEYHVVEDRVATPYNQMTEILDSMLKSPQSLRNLTSYDNNLLINRPKSSTMCKIQYSQKVVGFALLEYSKGNDMINHTLLSSILDVFSNSYSVLAINSVLAHKYHNAITQTYIDVKTMSLNSRKFNEDINALNKPYCIVAVDIDNFKRVNDNFGHDAGDEVISYVVQTLNKHLERLGGRAYREGGDEFLGLCTAPLEEVEKALQLALTEIKEHVFKDICGTEYSITNSAGLYYNEYGDTPEVSKKKVDILLYKSKENGKAHYTIDQTISIEKEM